MLLLLLYILKPFYGYVTFMYIFIDHFQSCRGHFLTVNILVLDSYELLTVKGVPMRRVEIEK